MFILWLGYDTFPLDCQNPYLHFTSKISGNYTDILYHFATLVELKACSAGLGLHVNFI